MKDGLIFVIRFTVMQSHSEPLENPNTSTPPQERGHFIEHVAATITILASAIRDLK